MLNEWEDITHTAKSSYPPRVTVSWAKNQGKYSLNINIGKNLLSLLNWEPKNRVNVLINAARTAICLVPNKLGKGIKYKSGGTGIVTVGMPHITVNHSISAVEVKFDVVNNELHLNLPEWATRPKSVAPRKSLMDLPDPAALQRAIR